MEFQTVNPATEEVIGTYRTMPPAEVLEVLGRAHAAHRAWRLQSLVRRLPYLRALALVLRRNKERYARLISLEMGKPITESRAEIEKCAWLSEVYAERSSAWLREERVEADGLRHRVAFEPLGVILSIMPWNYPFWQVLRCAVPALVAGNASLLKHASNVPQCAFAIEEALREAGFPPDLFRTVLADHETVATLIADERIAGVSLTGSTGAGSRVAELAGRHLKKVVLELGGSDPFIVLADANLKHVAQQAARGRLLSAGQSCIAAKRFIVVAAVAEEFTERFAARMDALVIGDPLEDRTQVGPVVSAAALEELQGQLAQSVELGARIVTGGERLPGKGFFLKPAVVARTTPAMRIVKEEVFGPIAPVIVVRDVEQAVTVANASPFGLGGSVWTPDLDYGTKIARRIEAGTVFVNSITKSDPRMPFGGIKQSGIGRELSKFGLREFVNVKGLSVYEHK